MTSHVFPILRDEIINLRSGLKVRDGLIQRIEAELRVSYIENAKLKEQLPLFCDDNAHSLEGTSKLRVKRSKYDRGDRLG